MATDPNGELLGSSTVRDAYAIHRTPMGNPGSFLNVQQKGGTSPDFNVMVANGNNTFGTIVVLGATGQQGGAVTRALLADGQWTIRTITRNPNSDAARRLAQCIVSSGTARSGSRPSRRCTVSDSAARAVARMLISEVAVLSGPYPSRLR